MPNQMSEQLIEALKAQIRTTSDPEQAKEAISLLEVYGHKAVPALRELMQECNIDEIKEYCKERDMEKAISVSPQIHI
jgi:hypothetical protein